MSYVADEGSRPGRWSDDAFLDTLRLAGDPPADATIAGLVAGGNERGIADVFTLLKANDSPLPASAPEPLKAFIAASAGLPPDLDTARLARGGQAFLRNAVPAVVVLLASSLPRGYAAPCLCEILSISRDLERHPYQRLMGVVQLLLNVSDETAFAPNGRAVVTAQKLRLLHAGVRHVAAKYRPHYQARFGVPVNHEDRLATIMAFSYLVVEGVRRLGTPFPAEEADDHYYLWRVFALLMGIHPEGRPHDWSYVPANLADAASFYASYVRRMNTGPDQNAYGVVLTDDNLKMMRDMIPRWLRLVGLGWAPQICMTELLTPTELARVGVEPLPGHHVIKALLALVLKVGHDAGEHTAFASRLAHLLLQGMVDFARGGEVEFTIPFDRLDLRGPGFE
jgi:hypothetical protein